MAKMPSFGRYLAIRKTHTHLCRCAANAKGAMPAAASGTVIIASPNARAAAGTVAATGDTNSQEAATVANTKTAQAHRAPTNARRPRYPHLSDFRNATTPTNTIAVASIQP